MQVAVESKYDETERCTVYNVASEATVGALKSLIYEEEGYECQLFLKDSNLDNSLSFRNIPVAGLALGSILTLHPELQLRVRTLIGRDVWITLLPDSTVLVLKELIYKSEGIPPDQQRLVHNGKDLCNDIKLNYYGITSSSNVWLMLRLKGGGEVVQKVQVSLCDWSGEIESDCIDGKPLFYGEIVRDAIKIDPNWCKSSCGRYFPSNFVKTESPFNFDINAPRVGPAWSFWVEPSSLPLLPFLRGKLAGYGPDIFKLKIGDNGLSFVQLEMRVDEYAIGQRIPFCLLLKFCLVPPIRVCSAVVSIEFRDNNIEDLQPTQEQGPEIMSDIKLTNYKGVNVSVGPEIQGISVGDVGWEKGMEQVLSSTISSRWKIHGTTVAPCIARWTFTDGNVDSSGGNIKNHASHLPHETAMSFTVGHHPDFVRVRMKICYERSWMRTKELDEKRRYKIS